jgi:ketosteroid isomerase-like protein
MSHENVEVVRSAFEAWNAGHVERLAEFFEADAEFLPFRAQLEGIVYRGPQGVRQFARDAREEWDVLRIASAEYRDLGEERVLVLGHMEGRAHASGMDLRVPAAWVIHMRGAKIAALRSYSNYEEALEAVGLRE